MSTQLGWFLTGVIIVIFLNSAGEQWDKDRGSARIQLLLGLGILLIAIGKIYRTWP